MSSLPAKVACRLATTRIVAVINEFSIRSALSKQQRDRSFVFSLPLKAPKSL